MKVETEIKIDKGIPIPARIGDHRHYPFPYMEVGDSFEVQARDGQLLSSFVAHVVSQAGKYKKCHPDKGIVWRSRINKENRSVRVWRIK
jgi:hypothetical protein